MAPFDRLLGNLSGAGTSHTFPLRGTKCSVYLFVLALSQTAQVATRVRAISDWGGGPQKPRTQDWKIEVLCDQLS